MKKKITLVLFIIVTFILIYVIFTSFYAKPAGIEQDSSFVVKNIKVE